MNKLCSISKGGISKDTEQKFVKMVRKPKYYCSKCGRVAKNAKKLCKPEDLK